MWVDCFEEAPQEWPRKPISDLAKIDPPYELEVGREYPFVEMASVQEGFGGISKFGYRVWDRSGLCRFSENDIILGKITPCAENGKAALVKGLPDTYGIGSTEFFVLSALEGVDPEFLFALITAGPFHRRLVSRMEGSTGRLRITRDTLKKWLAVPLPEPAEQRRIATTLNLADDAITKAKVELEATRELKRSLTAEILHPPKGASWNKTTYASLLSEKIRNGYSPSCSQDPTGAWVLALDALTDDGFNPKGIKPAPIEDDGLLPFRLVADDILVSRSNTPELVGRSGRYVGNPEIAYYPDLMMRVRVNRELVSPEFAEMLLQSLNARRWLKSRASGTSGSMVKIKRRDIMSLPVLLPDTTIQDEIVEAVNAAKNTIVTAQNKLIALQQLKKSLLQNLLTGKIRLSPGAVLSEKHPED